MQWILWRTHKFENIFNQNHVNIVKNIYTEILSSNQIIHLVPLRSHLLEEKKVCKNIYIFLDITTIIKISFWTLLTKQSFWIETGKYKNQTAAKK